VFVAGSFGREVFAGGSRIAAQVDGQNMFLARYDREGRHVFSVGSPAALGLSGLFGIVAHDGSLFATWERGVPIADCATCLPLSQAGLLALSSADGSLRWSRVFGEPGAADASPRPAPIARAVATGSPSRVASLGNLVARGDELRATALATGPFQHGDRSYAAAAGTPYIIAYGLDGAPRWSRQVRVPCVAESARLAQLDDDVVLYGTGSVRPSANVAFLARIGEPGRSGTTELR
jgi:hypothetical protein